MNANLAIGYLPVGLCRNANKRDASRQYRNCTYALENKSEASNEDDTN